jgi:DNA-binding response OmpR family regulator
VVEDSRRLQRALKSGLTRAGYAVDLTGEGEEGLWLAENNDYDAIILDLLLPGRDGLSILRQLRKSGRETHVLILTAKGAVEDRVTGLRAGADDYLAKPFSFSELLARVEALIRRRHGRKNPKLRLDLLEIDTGARVVTLDGHVVDLTPREYRLLELLAMKAGQVVSRAEIEEHLYDEATEIFSNVVDSTVSTLRKKLQYPGAGSLIRTRRGMGYMLEESS